MSQFLLGLFSFQADIITPSPTSSSLCPKALILTLGGRKRGIRGKWHVLVKNLHKSSHFNEFIF